MYHFSETLSVHAGIGVATQSKRVLERLLRNTGRIALDARLL